MEPSIEVFLARKNIQSAHHPVMVRISNMPVLGAGARFIARHTRNDGQRIWAALPPVVA